MVAITATEQNTEKRMKRSEDSLRDPGDNIKCTDIHITGVPAGGDREGAWERTWTDNSRKRSSPGKGNSRPSPGRTEAPGGMNPRRNTPRYTATKLTKTKDDKGKIKSNKGKTKNGIQGTPSGYQLISQQTLCKPDTFKVMKGKNLQPRITLFRKTLLQIWGRNRKLSRQAKVKRIQHHWMSFTINAKGTSPGRKHKRRKRPTENKPKTTKKTVTASYISIITLNVNGLNAPTKRHRLAGWMKTCACTYFHLNITLLDFPLTKLYIIILYY